MVILNTSKPLFYHMFIVTNTISLKSEKDGVHLFDPPYNDATGWDTYINSAAAAAAAADVGNEATTRGVRRRPRHSSGTSRTNCRHRTRTQVSIGFSHIVVPPSSLSNSIFSNLHCKLVML